MDTSKALLRTYATALVALASTLASAQSVVTLMHVHGLSYSEDGKRLIVPSHHGLAIYSAGRWSKAPGPEHDFMGFSSARDALYSSGHPAQGSSLRNPFGLLKSNDGGKTWESLGLTGEADFHVMAVSHGTSAIYVFAPIANSRMPKPGVYSTSNDGKTWKAAEGAGLAGRIAALAAHPEQANAVAAATEAGLFVSRNYGDRFEQLVPGSQATSVFFDLDSEHLWYGGYENRATLTRIALNTQKQQAIPIPAITKDAVAFIAQNPANRKEYAIATFIRDVYLSGDGGRTWKQIAAQGETH